MSAVAAAVAVGGALSIYVHWPFCRSKCPYCDFNSHVRERIDEDAWRDAYLAELACFAEETGRRPVSSVFFGGGTPSLMSPRTMATMLDRMAALWPLDAACEITLEANPSTAEAGRFRDFRAAGVGRLSIGVQALDDAALRRLGRGHSAADARAAVAMAAATFPRYSFDLIWGWPGQALAAWRRDLAEAVAMAGDHLSAYQLTIEPGTAFWRDGVAAAEEDLAVDLHDATNAALTAAGFDAYEISNFARSGGECRHNLAVWRGFDYLGIGPGAHGRLTRDGRTEATRQLKSPEKWLAQVRARGTGLADRVALSAAERAEELVMIGLRLAEGIDRVRFCALVGIEPEDAVDRQALGWLQEEGLIEADARGIRATAGGRQRLDAVLRRLLA